MNVAVVWLGWLSYAPAVQERAFDLREHAIRCRRLAAATYDRAVADRLEEMARKFDEAADHLDTDATALSSGRQSPKEKLESKPE